MLISCPKCSSVYNIKAEDVPEKGKKFKCAECGEIWLVEQKDLFDENSEQKKVKPQLISPSLEEDDENVRKMFELLGRDSKGLFDTPADTYTKNQKINKAIRHIAVNHSMLAINGLIMIIVLIMTAFILYFNRYDVVNLMPRMQHFYDRFGIENMYYGRDLKFSDTQTAHITKNGKHYIEIYGTIKNEGKYKSIVPPIKAVVTDAKGSPLLEIIKEPVISSIDAYFSSLFRILIEDTRNDATVLKLSFLSKEEKEKRNYEIKPEQSNSDKK